jgi:hypothetical protein
MGLEHNNIGERPIAREPPALRKLLSNSTLVPAVGELMFPVDKTLFLASNWPCCVGIVQMNASWEKLFDL